MISPLPLLSFHDSKYWFSWLNEKLDLPLGYHKIQWFESGAKALAIICHHLQKKLDRRLNILLPSYFCGQSLSYLRSLPINFHFYQIDESNKFKANAILMEYQQGAVDIMVHVHYFGMVTGQEESRAVANQLGALLIEDCAHVISPDVSEKWVGDVLLFSPHKYFAIPSLGLAIFKEDLNLDKFKSRKRLQPVWIAKNLSKRVLRNAPRVKWNCKWSSEKKVLEFREPVNWHKNICSRYLSGWEVCGEVRKNNQTKLLSKLEKITGWKPILHEHCIPYLLCMQCDTRIIAKRRFAFLNQNFQLTMQWPDLPSEIRNNLKLMELAQDWVEKRLFFFIHQTLEEKKWLSEIDKATNIEGF